METGRRLLDTTITFSLEQNGTRPERVSRGLGLEALSCEPLTVSLASSGSARSLGRWIRALWTRVLVLPEQPTCRKSL